MKNDQPFFDPCAWEIQERSFDCVPRRAHTARRKKARDFAQDDRPIRRDGWSTSSQACLPGTACYPPQHARAARWGAPVLCPDAAKAHDETTRRRCYKGKGPRCGGGAGLSHLIICDAFTFLNLLFGGGFLFFFGFFFGGGSFALLFFFLQLGADEFEDG